MKKRFFAVCLAVLMLIFQSMVFAADATSHDLSSGFSVLIRRSQLKKCSTVNTAVCFSANDFDRILGKSDYVTFLSNDNKKITK